MELTPVRCKRTRVHLMASKDALLSSVPTDFWPLLAEVVLKDLLTKLKTGDHSQDDQINLVRQLRTVSLMYSVNKATMAAIRAVYRQATRELQKEFAVRKACYDEMMVDTTARWCKMNPGLDWTTVTPAVAAKRGWPVRPVYSDPLDTMFRDMITLNTTVRGTLIANSAGSSFTLGRAYCGCTPFSASTTHREGPLGAVWPKVQRLNADSLSTDVRVDMFQWVKVAAANTCNVCNIFTEEESMGGSTTGRVCTACRHSMFVEVSTLCTRYGIYHNCPNGVDWGNLSVSRFFRSMTVHQVRQIDESASMLLMPAGERRAFQFVDMRSVFAAVSTAEDPKGEAALQRMGLVTQQKRSGAMRILWQMRMLRLRGLWCSIRHKKTPNVKLLTNNHIVLKLQQLKFSVVPNQLFLVTCEGWQPSSATVPEWAAKRFMQ